MQFRLICNGPKSRNRKFRIFLRAFGRGKPLTNRIQSMISSSSWRQRRKDLHITADTTFIEIAADFEDGELPDFLKPDLPENKH